MPYDDEANPELTKIKCKSVKDAGEAAHAYRTAVGLYDANAESNGTPYKLTKGHPIDAWGRATEMYCAERQTFFAALLKPGGKIVTPTGSNLLESDDKLDVEVHLLESDGPDGLYSVFEILERADSSGSPRLTKKRRHSQN